MSGLRMFGGFIWFGEHVPNPLSRRFSGSKLGWQLKMNMVGVFQSSGLIPKHHS